MLRRTPRALAASLLTLALLVGGAQTSTAAASPSVTIHKIAGKKAKWHKKVTIKPSVTVKGHVVNTHKSLTVKKGKKTLVAGKASAKLRAGRYRVITKVSYRTWKMVTRTVVTPTNVVELEAFTPTAATCTVSTETPDGTGEVPVEGVEVPTAYDLQLLCTSGSYTGVQSVPATAEDDGAGGWLLTTANGAPSLALTQGPSFVGAVVSPTLVFDHDLTRTDQVVSTYQEKVTSGKKSKTKTQALRITEGKRPSRTDPVSAYRCPSWAPLKGNASSMIYHLPGQRFYDVTKPEDCFTTQAAARHAGYRKSKV